MEQVIFISNIDPSQDLPVENAEEFIIVNDDYNEMRNKPTINEVEVVGNKTIEDYGGVAAEEGKELLATTDKERLANTSGTNTGDQVLPTKVSELTNDSNFITSSDLNTHNTGESSHNDIRQDIADVEAIARGKSRARVFETEAILDAWLAIPANVALLDIGDNLYIEEIDVPDYWWDGSQKQQLESEKVDLTPYYTKTEADNQFVEAEVGKRVIEDNEAAIYAGKQDAGFVPYFQTKTTLDAILEVGTRYNIGQLTGNITPTLPATGTEGQLINLIYTIGTVVYSNIPTNANILNGVVTNIVNTLCDIEYKYNATLNKWVTMPYVASTV